MTREELKSQIIELCDNSGLSLNDKVSAVRAAMTRVQMNVGTKSATPKFAGPLLRPGGKMMGKQKSQPKEKD